MRSNFVQTSLYNVYTDMSNTLESDKSNLLTLLDTHIDFNAIIPYEFNRAYYKQYGRSVKYHLESMLRLLVLQNLFGLTNQQVLFIMQSCLEFQRFCGFDKIPDPSKLSRFKQDYCKHLGALFENLVSLTEPICRELDAKKADYLIFDTTGIEPTVAENNPKFFNAKLREAKKYAKGNPNYNPYIGVYSLLPKETKANPNVQQQYVNGHYCYAFKAGILTNGLGIVRSISFFDETFKKKHPQTVTPRSDDPTKDKEISDSAALQAVLEDFFTAHNNFSYRTFLGDSAFDSYDNYTLLKNKFHFSRACIPLNPRNAKNASTSFDKNGVPICPLDGTPFTYVGKCAGKNRSLRFKYVCHKSIKRGSKRICTCESPCTNSSYGRCTYTYPDKDFRMYPGIPRGTEHFDNLYRHRVLIERTIGQLKSSFCLEKPKSFCSNTVKANLYMAASVQLIGVLLAKALHQDLLFKSLRTLMRKVA